MLEELWPKRPLNPQGQLDKSCFVCVAETPFGDLEGVLGRRQFRHRGLEQVDQEWRWSGLSLNFKNGCERYCAGVANSPPRWPWNWSETRSVRVSDVSNPQNEFPTSLNSSVKKLNANPRLAQTTTKLAHIDRWPVFLNPFFQSP